MNNEETILDEQFATNNSSKKEAKNEPQPTESQAKKNNSGEKWAYGTAGVVIGAGATMAGQAVAANAKLDEPETEVETEDVTESGTQDEVAVQHEDITVHHVHHVHHEHTYVNENVHTEPEIQTTTEIDPQTVSEQQDDVDVRIIDAGETDINGDGVPEYSVLLDCNGQEVLIVDIDTDGTADVAISDLDGNGQISENEIADISDQNLEMPGMQPDTYMASNDDMPDYMNDADTGSYTA